MKTILLLLVSTNLFAQTVFTSPYGDTATIFRISEKEMQKLQKENSGAAAFLKRIYKNLDKANAIVKTGNYEKDQWPDMDLSSDFVMGGLSPQPYKSEIELYKNYQINKEAVLKASEDSLRQANWNARVAEERAKRDSISLARQMADRKADSIKDVRDSIAAIQYEIDRAIAAEKDKADSIARRKDCIKRFGATLGPVVAARELRLGMNKEMCIEAWGYPSKESKTTADGIIIETYYYPISRFVIFKNGKISVIHE